jgi:sugar lactone lactonase YvrE
VGLTLRILILIAALAAPLAAPRGLTIETIAGDGTPGFSATQVDDALGLATGPDGALYFSDSGNHRIRRLDLTTHLLATIAGNGEKGNTGDGGLAVDATLNRPLDVAFDTSGNLYISDSASNVVRRVDARSKTLKTIAGTGNAGFSGDGGSALKAEFNGLSGIAFAKDGSLLICDSRNNRIRRVDLITGIVETIAGTGESKLTPDGNPILGTPLNGPRAMAVDQAGNIYVALPTTIYRLDMRANRIVHIAGMAREPDRAIQGDGPGSVLPHLSGDAKLARLSSPKGIGLSSDGGSLYVADTEAQRILRIDLKNGTIETVAGTGERGDTGVGSHRPGIAASPDGDASTCKLSRPHGIVVGSGVVYFTDTFSNRIRALR